MLKYFTITLLTLLTLSLSYQIFINNDNDEDEDDYILLKISYDLCQSNFNPNFCNEFNNLYNKYREYLNNHNKSYNKINNNEHWIRFKNYIIHNTYINEHNERYYKGLETWQAGHTKFTDMIPKEWNKIYNGYKRPDFVHYKQNIYNYTNNSLNFLPSSIDWRANGWVSNIKDQGQCGSCWAFSTTGVLEGQHANVTGNLVTFSEENIVDCVDTCEGCGGGWPYLAEDYVVQNGIDTENSYPYTAGDGISGNCSFNKTNIGARFTQVIKLPQGDGNALYHAVGTVGPVSVAIYADYDLMMYKSGIYSSKTCSSQTLNHAVLVVGYGITNKGQKYYIIKNSWGTNWGMDGYVYWDATDSNMCGIAQDGTFVYALPNTKLIL